MSKIGHTARIHASAEIGEGCRIGEFCIVEQDVVLGANCVLEPYVYVKRWTTLGNDNEISAGTVLGTDPLDKAFTGERSYLRIGNGNKIREHFTISRGTKAESATVIGDGNYIMTSGHIAHDCRIGNNTVICSCALIAGYADIGDGAFISGGVVVHQYSGRGGGRHESCGSKIGTLAMIGGNTRVNLDAPPYFLYSGFDIEPCGVNVVGLKRAGFSLADIANLKTAYRLLYRVGLPVKEALTRIADEVHSEHAQQLVSFVNASSRGICRPS